MQPDLWSAPSARAHASEVETLAELARELALKAGEHGITVASLRIVAVQRGYLTGQEQGRHLSYLGAVMKRAGLLATSEFRRSHIEKAHGNLGRVWRAA